MLMDMLGILTGFIAIMLLFSLLVTALVQGAQAAETFAEILTDINNENDA